MSEEREEPTRRSMGGGSERLREVLRAAMDREPDERRAFVEARLEGEEELEDALSLLDEVDGLGDFLEGAGLFAPPRPFQPPLPERIGRYRVERLIGWGSMGVVYLATQDAPRRQVALKVLRLDASSPKAARRFEHEGQVLARLAHPGIAAIHEAGVTDLGAGPQPFLAMEYVDGPPIDRFAEREELDRRGRVALVARVARALAHAHAQGVLHRDLKPENVLVQPDGRPCVLDFGVARTSDEEGELLQLTATGQVIGTLAYMAPEQARGATLDARADQFALGAILLELLTGELPFDVRGRLPHEALGIIARGDTGTATRHGGEIDGDLEAILATALAPEPARRYRGVEAFAEDLERWLAGESVVARAPTTLDHLGRFVRRNRGLSAALAVGLFALGGALTWGTVALLDLRREERISLLFSDLRLLTALEEQAVELWPTDPELLPRFETWIARAEELVAHRPRQRAAIEDLEAPGTWVAAAGAHLESDWLSAEGRGLLESMEAFEGELLPEMRTRAELCRRLPQETLHAVAADWRAAAARVAADERFNGLRLAPQVGLLPLGPDPGSGLEEFALWCSGERPRRDPETGLFAPSCDDAVVLVLIPGGSTWIGAQRSEPGGPNYDPRARTPPSPTGNEGPPFRARLDPYLLSKYELTQAQWIRLAGYNPSDWEVGTVIAERRVTALHPVESLSWEQVMRWLPRWGLGLPTEAQWEHAARAGGVYRYMVGDSWRDLIGHASWNSHRQTVGDAAAVPDDGYVTHMPVGRLAPNGYGLHDVIGNVWEFCLDTYKVKYHQLEHRDGDGLVLCAADGDVSRRGLCCGSPPSTARVGFRSDRRFDGRDALTGLRPARRLELAADGAEEPGG